MSGRSGTTPSASHGSAGVNGTDQLAQALNWTLERTTTALGRARATPTLAGPLALRRVTANTYTVTPRLDLLTSVQRRQIHDTVRWNQPLDVDQANVLLAALVLHNNEYANMPDPSYAQGSALPRGSG